MKNTDFIKHLFEIYSKRFSFNLIAERYGISLAGFRTVTVPDIPGAFGSVHIIPAAAPDPVYTDASRVGIRWGPGKGAEAFPAHFDRRGSELLRDEEQANLILMDEIGKMEAAAPVFCAGVQALMEGDVPILGVLRQEGETALQAALRAHPHVRLITVTTENRNRLPEDRSGPISERCPALNGNRRMRSLRFCVFRRIFLRGSPRWIKAQGTRHGLCTISCGRNALSSLQPDGFDGMIGLPNKSGHEKGVSP